MDLFLRHIQSTLFKTFSTAMTDRLTTLTTRKTCGIHTPTNSTGLVPMLRWPWKQYLGSILHHPEKVICQKRRMLESNY